MTNKILIMGTPVAPGNRGVMALGASLVYLCRTAMKDAPVAFLQVHKPADDVLVRLAGGDVMVPVVTCRMSPRAKLKDHLLWILLMSFVYRMIPVAVVRKSIRDGIPWIDAVVGAELVGDVRGGDSFSDIYGLKRFVIAALPILTVLLLKGRIVHFPQTYGPFKNRTARLLARLLLRRSSSVTARDPQSRKIAQELVGDRLLVGLSPDVAFALHPVRPELIEAEPAFTGPMSDKTIGLNVNGLMLNGGYTGKNQFGLKLDYRKFVSSVLIELFNENPVDILLVPHTFAVAGDPESDNEACRMVRDGLPDEVKRRVRIVTGDYDPHELKGIIGQCDFFIGSRMHSCIAALSQGVPCVGVAYSMKFKGVFDSVGVAEWVVDGRDVDDEHAVRRVLELYRLRGETRGVLGMNADSARGRLAEVFGQMMQHADRTSNPDLMTKTECLSD